MLEHDDFMTADIDPRVRDLWLARDFMRENPTSVIKTRIRRLERELRDEGIDVDTRPATQAITRYVAYTSNRRHDLGGAIATHADRHCHVLEQYEPCVDVATPEEVARLKRCGFCG